jgi:hypothetical protein
MNQTVVAPTRATAPLVTIGANFEGADQSIDLGVAFDPPDTDGAAGPNAIVELLNNLYRVYDKSGALLQTSRLQDFWLNAGVTVPGFAFDPRVVFDPASQRWFASSTANAGVPGNPILLAVSNTSDPTQGWKAFSISSDPTGQTRADFPMLGLNEDGLFIVANMFVGDTNLLSSEKVIAIPKADLLQPVPTAVNATVIDNVSVGDTGSFPHPAVAFQSFGPELLLSANDDNRGGSSSLKVTSIDGPITSPFLNTADRLVSVTPELQALTATQKGTDVLLDLQPFSEFTSSVVFQNDKMFAVQGVQHNGLAALRWLEIGDSLTNPVLLDSGIINPPNLNVYDGSIAVNAFGQVLIGFSGSGPNDYPSAYAVAGTLIGDHLQLGDPMLLKAGDGPFIGLPGSELGMPKVRWGDYSATTIDPVDPTHFWTTEEWAADKGSLGIVWSTEVTEIIFAPPTPSVQSWFGGTGNFSDPQNWSPPGSPATTDTLVIEGGRVRVENLTITNPNIELGSPATTPTLVLQDSTLAAASSVRVETTTFDPSQPDLDARIRVVGAVTEDGAIDVGTTGTDVNQLFPAHLTISMANGSTFTMDPGAIWFSSDGSTLDVNGPERTAQFVNDGEIEAFGGTVRMNVSVTGQGTFDVLFNNNNIFAGTLEFTEDVGAGETVKLDAGLLKLDEPLHFLGSIENFNPNSTIELAHTKVTSADYSDGVLTLFDKHHVEAQLHIAGDFTTDQFMITNHDGNAFITLNPTAPVSADQGVNGVSSLNLDKQVAQLVSAMATQSASNSDFNPTTLPTQTQDDSSLQSTLAPAWHS